MWAEGSRQEVLDYCAQDVRATYQLAVACHRRKALVWTSKSNRRQSLWLPDGWLTVAEAIRTPHPNTTWMSEPIPREEFTNWLYPQTPQPSQH